MHGIGGGGAGQPLTIAQALALAHDHFTAGRAAQAEQLCRLVLGASPEQPDALHLLGLLAHGQGNPALALDFLRRACAAPLAPAPFHSNRAELCRQAGLLDEAEAAGRRALALDPANAAALGNLGIVLQERGKLAESRDCLARAVALVPGDAQAHNNLGNTLKLLDQLDEARRHYQIAIALAPDYAEPHANLAHLLTELGEVDAALAAASRAVALNPRHADGYLNAAAAEIERGAPDAALAWLEQLQAFAPDHVGALAAQATALAALDLPDQAAACARRAVALAPGHPQANLALGNALQAMGDTDEAARVLERAAGLPGVRPPEAAQVALGVLLMEAGRKPEAMACFDHALAAAPHSAKAWFHRAEARSFRRDDADLARMEELAQSGQVVRVNDRIMLEFALGKAWMDAGDAARAFAHLDLGNRLKRSALSYDAAATEAMLAAVARSYHAPMFAAAAGHGHSSDLPIFVIGMPRSGTTLVEQVLASLPGVHGAGELPFMRQMVEQVRGPDLRPLGYPALLGALRTTDLAPLGGHYLEQVARLASGCQRVVDKMPGNFLYAGLIHMILPNARIIHCRRDKVDTCLSCYSKLFSQQPFTYDLAELGGFYRGYQAVTARWAELLPADRYTEVWYEDMVGDLAGQARRLVEFCGLAWDEACLAFHQTRRQVRTASMGQVRQPLYRSSIGRWKPYAAYLGPLLAALGVDAVTPAGAGADR